MTLFSTQSAPRIFGLAPGVDFGAAFLEGLHKRLDGQPPEDLARVEIFVNTQRTRRRIQAFYDQGPARLLPRIRLLPELGNEAGSPTTSPLRRQLDLSQLVAALIDVEPNLGARTAAFELAGSLMSLMGEMQAEGLEWDALSKIDPGTLSGHWQRSLRFLELIRPYLEAEGRNDPDARMRRAVETRIAAWEKSPPTHPVLITGSTGSRAPTALLMQAVAKLPKGAVVLPGYDDCLPEEVWRNLSDGPAATDHPQFGFAHLAKRIGFDPQTVPNWADIDPPSPKRNALVSLSLRPAPVTHQWLRDGPQLKPSLIDATRTVTLIDGADPREEAKAIALRLRQALEDGQQAALVTPDRNLTRRVTAILDRWHVTADDSAGRPLLLTPPGVFLRMLLSVGADRLTPVDLLALLKHPLCAGAARSEHLQFTRALEIEHLCGGAPFIDWTDLNGWAQKRHGQLPGLPAWLEWLETTLAPMQDAGSKPLSAFLERHIQAAEALSRGWDKLAETALWDKTAGTKALEKVEAFRRDADAGGQISPSEYRSIFNAVFSEEVPDEPYAAHEEIAIWGTLEARTQSAQLVILAGLNEGIWPRLPDPDPWLNREMRARIGLPAPERRIGLSAHDFQLALGAKEVVLSRSVRDSDAPTVASRWLMRLSNLLSGLGEEGKASLATMQARGAALCAQARMLDQPQERIAPAMRPSPLPPVNARPDQLSVTRIETLIRDPYQIYAQYILNLRRLDPPGRSPDALARGTVIHAILEQFIRETVDGLPENAAEIFTRTAAGILHEAAPWPAVRSLWMARLMRVRDSFLADEKKRRTAGSPQLQGLEIAGKRVVSWPQGDFTLTAKADRIDRAHGGGHLIYDYKSGAIPTERQAGIFDPQLPLEAAIAQAGGFSDLGVAAVKGTSLIGLGTDPKMVERDYPRERIDQIWNEFCEIIAAYQSPETGYTARLRPSRITYASDYDQLSRFGEWDDSSEPFAEPVGGQP